MDEIQNFLGKPGNPVPEVEHREGPDRVVKRQVRIPKYRIRR
jgi:hypothetical protein